jgi:hypothetical protein
LRLDVGGNLTVDGRISADGGNGSVNSDGGGSGGSVYITVGNALSGTGTIQANGGNGGLNGSIASVGGGGGGGGRVAVYYNAIGGTFPATGAVGGAHGLSGQAAGSPGTVHLAGPQPANITMCSGIYTSGTYTNLTIGAGCAVTFTGSLSVSGTLLIADTASLLVQGVLTATGSVSLSGNLTLQATSTIQSFGFGASGSRVLTIREPAGLPIPTVTINTDLIVVNGTAVVVDAATQANVLRVLGNVTVAAGGAIHADALGCPGSQSGLDAGGCAELSAPAVGGGATSREGGDQTGQSSAYVGGGGGAYGGAGADGVGAANPGGTPGQGGDQTYGSSTAPVLFGSGGGAGRRAGTITAVGTGGGALRLDVGGNLTVNGRISADGGNGSANSDGGGSGGSVYITVGNALSGTGTIRANGGNGGLNGSSSSVGGGGGGGGRVAVYYSNAGTPFPAVTANGGAHGLSAQGAAAAGSVVKIITDIQPPAPISPLTTGAVTSTSIVLNWTATGDNGNSGTASYYDLRYRTVTPIASEADYQTAVMVAGEPAPAVAGTLQSFRVTGLNYSTTYCFAIKAVDDAGNASALDLTPADTSTVCATTEAQDTTPPAPVANLAANPMQIVSGVDYTDRLSVTWTATGDDGSSGTAFNQELRYRAGTISGPVDDALFNSLVKVGGLGLPQTAPAAENIIVTGLLSNQLYSFVLKVCDEVPQCVYSNVAVQTVPLDVTPPANVTTLAVGSPVTNNSITLTFLSPGDDGTPAPVCPCGTPASYIIKYQAVATVADPNPIVDQPSFDAAVTAANVLLPLPAGQAQSVTITSLTPGTRYYFAVEAVDEMGNQGGLSNIPVSAVTQVGVDTIPPGQITDLQVVVGTVTDRTVQLQWTAKGDDGDMVGAAAAFDIRYSHNPITDANFNTALQVTGEPIPGPPGTGHSMTVTVTPFQYMTSNTAYYFAIKAIDDGGNRSTLGTLTNSNVDGTCTVNCKARTALRTHYNLVSVPLHGPLSPAAVFGPLDLTTDACGPGDLPCLYKWISSGLLDSDGYYQLMDPCGPYCVMEGDGYFFYTAGVSLLTAPGSPVPTHPGSDGHRLDSVEHAHITLQQGWSLIGNLFDKDVLLKDVNVRRVGGGSCTETIKTFAQAVDPDGIPNNGDEWVGNAIYVSTTDDGGGSTAVTFDDGNALTQDATLQPWQAYWFQVLKNDCTYELVVPKP